ncbi:MarR family winged helix-turn-helix transcriptional regulator [Bacillus wiedmannii]|uniref:Transcriptional regulator n=1 Tax=Bacillus wiedmannii TaxID=1890302 RepID=A0A2B6SBQ8_9BACI|nr:MarR family winged helix-turn-helix transcriptional regulator [Bacillus wiedmannii]PGD38362.1 transcriptional regulator [Bacillus wiedmannii]
MFYKKLAAEFFEFMVKAQNRSMGPLDTQEFSRGEMGILVYLTFKKDGVTSGQLSEALYVSTGRIATALKGLEKKNLIERRTDSMDKRRVNVYIMEAGKQIILEKHEQALKKMEMKLQKLGKEDAQKFVELSKRVFS